MKTPASIAPPLLVWWDEGHADLPWRGGNPYAVWVSEIMLQQTQITAVIPYYQRWMAAFPTVETLAAAPLDDVLKLWEGLGYYSRARNLHAAAQTVVADYSGELPSTLPELLKLKGIGRYTAGAIASIAFDQPVSILDGNIIRILSRLIDLDQDVGQTAVKNQLWSLSDGFMAQRAAQKRPGDFNQALMELGQRICRPKTPACAICPLTAHCLAFQRGAQASRPIRAPRKKTPHYDVAAGVIWQRPLRGKDQRFLIAKRPLDGLLGGLWEFPGGKQEAGETLPQTLRREIMEELGIEIEVQEALIVVNHAFTHFRISLHAMHAVHVGGQPQLLEVADHAWVTLADVDACAFGAADQKIIAALRKTL